MLNYSNLSLGLSTVHLGYRLQLLADERGEGLASSVDSKRCWLLYYYCSVLKSILTVFLFSLVFTITILHSFVVLFNTVEFLVWLCYGATRPDPKAIKLRIQLGNELKTFIFGWVYKITFKG